MILYSSYSNQISIKIQRKFYFRFHSTEYVNKKKSIRFTISINKHYSSPSVGHARAHASTQTVCVQLEALRGRQIPRMKVPFTIIAGNFYCTTVASVQHRQAFALLLFVSVNTFNVVWNYKHLVLECKHCLLINAKMVL